MNRVSLKDRVATIVYTDERGVFEHGPSEIDSYELIIRDQMGYKFERIGDTFDFKGEL